MRSAFFDPVPELLPPQGGPLSPDDRLLAAWAHLSDQQIVDQMARSAEPSIDVRAARRRVLALRAVR